ncbi:MAG: phospholipase D-like domain-containing protein [Planctomycetota bacterium]
MPPLPDFTAPLLATLDDYRLTRSENQALRQLANDHLHDPEALARFRNTAFRVAEQRLDDDPHAVLAWLNRVDKTLDNLRRQDTPAKPDLDTAFSPGDDCLAMILGHLRSARKAVDVCVFTITDNRVTRALLDTHRRGVTTRIITDNDKRFDAGSDIHQLRDAGLPVRCDPDENHMHHKFALIDRTTLLTGSYNWTRGATRNHENLIALTHPTTLRRFQSAFDQLWHQFASD